MIKLRVLMYELLTFGGFYAHLFMVLCNPVEMCNIYHYVMKGRHTAIVNENMKRVN